MSVREIWAAILKKLYFDFAEKAALSERETFDDELNFHLVRFLPIIYTAGFLPLLWIPLDLIFHPYPLLAVSLRVLPSAAPFAGFFIINSKNALRSMRVLGMVLTAYMVFYTTVLALYAGQYMALYFLTVVLCLMFVIGAIASLKFKMIVLASGFFLYLAYGIITGVNFTEPIMFFVLLVMCTTLSVSMYTSWVIDRNRYQSWKLYRTLRDEVRKNEENLKTISDLAQKAEKLAHKAEEASRAKTNFLAKMSHEIRTPMNAITGITELAMREEMAPALQEQLMIIKQSGTGLISIINDILDFSKIESGKIDIAPSEYFLSEVINDVVNIIKVRLIESNVQFAINLDSSIPNKLFGDKIRIRQILLNILSNAVKYTAEGHILFSIGFETETDASAGAQTITLVCKVRDTGKGIKPENIARLYDDFAQFDSDSNSGVEGSGLGLPITKSLLTAMNGDISVVSQYGSGSEFTVKIPQGLLSDERLAAVDKLLPNGVLLYERRQVYADSIAFNLNSLGVSCKTVATAQDFNAEIAGLKAAEPYDIVFIEASLATAAAAASGGDMKIVMIADFAGNTGSSKSDTLVLPAHSLSIANVLNGKTETISKSDALSQLATFTAPDANILIVDDIETNLYVVKGLLKPYEMQVNICSSGIKALEAVEWDVYDLILMDHMMPGIDGIEATKRIRQYEGAGGHYKNAPIVVLTANAISGVESMFLENGFDDCLFKPIDTAKLNLVLEKWIPKDKQIKFSQAGGHEKPDESPQWDAADFTVEGLNIQRGLDGSGGNLKNYKFVLGVFQKDVGEKSKEIEAFLESGKIREYTIVVHSLKGALANIGGESLAQAAAALEAAGKAGDLPFIEKNNGDFLAGIRALAADIGDAVKEDALAPSAAPDLLFDELERLSAAINERDSSGIEASVEVLDIFSSVDGIGEIINRSLAGNYDEVVKLIEAMLREKASPGNELPGEAG
ncbi:MAG: ATP-binding protein, partial [Spirochaetes bacterium]|nr:ATP-binding protein [Spirochaetota bacterium]